MGKTAKRRKELKRKREKEQLLSKYAPISKELAPTEEELVSTARTLTHLATLDFETLHCKSYKEIRRSIFAFASAAGEDFGEGKTHRPQWIARISDSLRDQQWSHAMELMRAARVGIVPKLGTLQRWVRDADLAGNNSSENDRANNWVVLDAILRTSQQPTFRADSSLSHKIVDNGTLRIFEAWDPLEGKNRSFSPEFSTEASPDLTITLVTTEKRWKGVRDLSIYTTDALIIPDSPTHTNTPQKVPLPFVDGGFVFTDIFSREECNRLIGTAERMAFEPDAEYAVNPEKFTADSASAAAGVVWLANEQLVSAIFNRVKDLLPQELGGGALAGLNSRLRVYRYESGAVYRPHVDGAWPGSGIVNGNYVFDAYGDRWSRLTFLIYLNEAFEGGSTTFYGPSSREGVLDGRGVIPRVGSVLIFPHGDTAGALVHEGSEVTSGTKYVIRSDVLYIGKQEASLGAPIEDNTLTGTKRSINEQFDTPSSKMARVSPPQK